MQKYANSPERLPLAYTTYCVDVDEDSFYFNYCIKPVSHAIDSHVLPGKNPCINQAIYVLLMHGFSTLHMRILGRHKN